MCRAWWKTGSREWEQTLIKRAPVTCLDPEEKTAAHETGCSTKKQDKEPCTEEDKENCSTNESARVSEQVRRPTPICPLASITPRMWCVLMVMVVVSIATVASGNIVQSIVKGGLV